MKKYLHTVTAIGMMFVLAGCNLSDDPESIAGFTNDLCYQTAFNNGVVFRLDGKIWLRAGEEDNDHFDISNSNLKPCNYNLGLGREFYPALIEPEYVLASDHAEDYKSSEPVYLVYTENAPKVYPIDLLRSHEIINETVKGNPVLVYYSILSDRGAVYKRRYCDTTFTFAVSGYTYLDFAIEDATSSFLLWDRETESLWWPMISKAVSGLMKGNWLVEYNTLEWMETTWEDVLQNHPEALVLKSDQPWEPPDNWPRYAEVSCK
jgi:hypothetical protein